MYLLALDESGTHGGSPVMIVGGLAIHERDARPLQTELDAVVHRHLSPLGLDPLAHELHATDIRKPKGARPATATRGPRQASLWKTVPLATRTAVLEDAYRTLAQYEEVDNKHPWSIFACIIDARHRKFAQRERHAYDHVLHRFDEMVAERSTSTGVPQHGLVIHDRRSDEERNIQDRASTWRRTAGRLTRLADVPLFADSRATRLLQAADLVNYALWRQFSTADTTYSGHVWPRTYQLAGRMTGAIHITPAFRTGACGCPPCQARS